MVFSDGGEGLGEVGHARMTMLAHDWLLDVEVEREYEGMDDVSSNPTRS